MWSWSRSITFARRSVPDFDRDRLRFAIVSGIVLLTPCFRLDSKSARLLIGPLVKQARTIHSLRRR